MMKRLVSITMFASWLLAVSPTVEADEIGASSAGIIPDIGDGGGISTSITIVNLDSRVADFQLFFRDFAGKPLPLPIVELQGPNLATVSGKIPVGASVTLTTPGQESNYTEGWALLLSPSSAAFGATIVQRFHADGVPDTEATFSLTSVSEFDFRMVFDNRNGAQAGLMLINTNGATDGPKIDLSVTLRGFDGTFITRATVTLSPLQKIVSFLPNDFPLSANLVGTVEVTGLSDTGVISAIGFRVNKDGNPSFYEVLSVPGVKCRLGGGSN